MNEPARPGPLAGVGVIVTRPARQAAGLAAQLAALGATPIVFPAIAILPPADDVSLRRAHEELASYDAAIFISGNAAEYGAPGTWPAHVAAYATGPGTAAALRAVGVPDVAIPETTFDSEGLLALPALADVRGKRIAIFRGEGGREHLASALQARGARVDGIECYRRVRPSSADGLAEALLHGRAHALTVTSSEGLDNLCALLDPRALAAMRAIPAFVAHPRIEEHARELGFGAIVTGAGDAGLVAGLLEWFERHPRTR
ncbi:MAG: uroporphyrinogen-III synthase [Burkholderiales bacterium]